MRIKDWLRRQEIKQELGAVYTREDLVRALTTNKKLDTLLRKEDEK